LVQLRHIVDPFYSKRFSLMFLTTVSASFADFLMDVSSGWLVLDLTDSPLSLGLFYAIRSSPNLFFGMVGGATTDKMDRRRLLMVCYALYSLMGASIGYLITTGQMVLWHALTIIFTRGVIRAFESPARQSLTYCAGPLCQRRHHQLPGRIPSA